MGSAGSEQQQSSEVKLLEFCWQRCQHRESRRDHQGAETGGDGDMAIFGFPGKFFSQKDEYIYGVLNKI